MPASDAPTRTGWRRLARILGFGDRLPIDPDLSPDDAGEPSPTHRAHAPHPRRAAPGVLAAILAGGLLGTLGRYGVGLALPTPAGGFPADTFVVNASGALVLGFLLAAMLERGHTAPHLRPFAATGLLGGWTTYSSFAVEVADLGRRGDLAQAAGYLACTLLAGVTASALGIALGRAGVRASPADGAEGAPAAMAEEAGQ